MLQHENSLLAVGLMSGTSLDGVDGALIRTDGKEQVERIASVYFPYEESFREEMMALAKGDIPLSSLLRLEQKLTLYHAQAVKALMVDENAKNAGKPDVVGFHGQTIRHMPDEGLTWQIGNPSLLAAKTDMAVVSDFRRRDMAVGGQGAPLAPLYHKAILANQKLPAVVLNLGGVSNITYISQSGGIIAGDIGPGCSLLDQWAQKHTNKPYDEGGKLAFAGKADVKWVNAALQQDEFFKKPFPKSADRYQFDGLLPTNMSAADGAASLCLLTVQSIVESIQGVNKTEKALPTLWLTGGGAQNPAIVAAFKEAFNTVKFVDELGASADMLEAECFAWLAVRRLLGLPTSIPETTGAACPTVGGVLTV